MLSRPHKRPNKGFTLLELMIVISILGILAAILLPVLMRARLKSYHTACAQNERNIATALQMYANEHKDLYPATLEELTDNSDGAPFIQHIDPCPSNNVSYTATYAPSADLTEYHLPCPGIHEAQLPGLVQDGYPQVINGELFQYGPP